METSLYRFVRVRCFTMAALVHLFNVVFTSEPCCVSLLSKQAQQRSALIHPKFTIPNLKPRLWNHEMCNWASVGCLTDVISIRTE